MRLAGLTLLLFISSCSSSSEARWESFIGAVADHDFARAERSFNPSDPYPVGTDPVWLFVERGDATAVRVLIEDLGYDPNHNADGLYGLPNFVYSGVQSADDWARTDDAFELWLSLGGDACVENTRGVLRGQSAHEIARRMERPPRLSYLLEQASCG